MNKTPTENEVKDAIKNILADEAKYYTTLNFAVEYCRCALVLSGQALKTQVMYILNNITYWRNKNAKNVRSILKAYIN